MMKRIKSGYLSVMIVSLIWGSGAVIAMMDAGTIPEYPPYLLKARAIVILYVLFLFENVVSYMDILAQDRSKRMGTEAVKSLLILNVGTAICFLCLLCVVFMEVDWPNWIILVAALLMKSQVESFKKHSEQYFDSIIYRRIILNS